jgi:hypothetical protein
MRSPCLVACTLSSEPITNQSGHYQLQQRTVWDRVRVIDEALEEGNGLRREFNDGHANWIADWGECLTAAFICHQTAQHLV